MAKKTKRKKTTPRRKRKTTRRRTHYPSVKKHGKTAAERKKYISYRSEVDRLKKKYWG
jgi:hypothetical protein